MTEAMYAQIRAAEDQMRLAEERAGKLKDVHAALSGLVGVGTAADDRVQAEWSAGQLSRLELDPRAMKMASVDLAAAIKEAVNAASADLGAKSRQAMLDSGVVDEAALDRARDPESVRRFVTEQRERMQPVIRPAAGQIADARRR